ncbi:HAD family hydrolase [Selenomonas sp. TAMA-11512]|uniref:HAD family hydrolase n=1 Tax=Selenomonas sp. TAMA-11512 TaxID=3095337 RepID=UPI00308B9BF3|nr:HAD family hydrolase [Selenomonas sp. TAMA-11512]
MQYRAVIFDLDGTLIDSLEDLADSVNQMLRNHGLPTHTSDAVRLMIGNGTQKLIERALPKEYLSDADFVKAAVKEYKEIYQNHILEKTRSYPGILEMLHELSLEHIPMGICTNKHVEAAETIVKILFEEKLFQIVLGDCPGKPKKPDPTTVLEIASVLSARPEEVVYLGDSAVDMETATRAGFLPVGVLWGFRDKEELVGAGAKILLEHPMDLFDQVTFVRV